MAQPARPNPWLAWFYLALAIAGGVLPWMANLDFMRDYGASFDLRVFIDLANANPAAQSLSRDLLIGATVTARKDDAPAAVQAAIVNVAGLGSCSVGGGLIQTTSG